MIVVDASVATKWFLKEEYSEHAIDLLTLEQKLIGPALVLYEVSGAILRAARQDYISFEKAEECRSRLFDVVRQNALRLEHEMADVKRGFEIAMEVTHSLQDCIYLALAERYDATLVTADSKFVDKLAGHFERVVHLKDAVTMQPAAISID